MEPLNWRQRIVQLVLVKERIREVDVQNGWEHRLPGVAATEEQLVAVEAEIGEPLDPEYRSFLKFAGGWPAFLQRIDLFGPDDFLGSPRGKKAKEMLEWIEDSVLREAGVKGDQLLPIAASSTDVDLFVITRGSSAMPGVVIWFAGGEIERFPTFDEYFAAMVDYNRAEIDRISQQGH